MTEPTIKERINNYLGNGGLWNPEAIEHDKVRTLLIDCRDYLAALDAQPVPVEPEWIKSLLRQIKEREDDDANTPCQLLLVLAYACVNDFVHLQSALKLAQEAKQAAVDLWSNTGETLQKADDTLRKISSVIGQGGMWDTENLDYDEVYARISDGINAHLNIQRERAEKAEQANRRMVELMKEPSEGMKVAGWNALKPSADDCLLGAAFEAMSAELLKEATK